MTKVLSSFIRKDSMAKKWRIIIWLIACVLVCATSIWAKSKKPIKKIVIKEVTRVEGKIQKPEVWYLLPRSNLNFEGTKRQEKLAPKIIEPIKKKPF